MKNITRPWQATLLAFLGGIKFSLNSIIFLLLLFFKGWFGEWLSQFDPNLIVISAIKPSLLIPIFISIVFLFFVIRGLWKGQKWAPVFLVCIHGIGLLLTLFWGFESWQWIIPTGILLFFMALEIECWRDPFFNQKKQ